MTEKLKSRDDRDFVFIFILIFIWGYGYSAGHKTDRQMAEYV